MVSDESGDSANLDRLLDKLMKRALTYSQTRYLRPQTCLGVGGMKIFRDDIYGRLRMIFPADHRAYKQIGLYKTFPQAEFDTTLKKTFAAPIVNLPPIRKKFDKMIKKQIIMQHKQVVAKAS